MQEDLERWGLEKPTGLDYVDAQKSIVVRETTDIPRDGDAVTGLTVHGGAGQLRVNVFGVHVVSMQLSGRREFIPVTINLMRLGYHTARVELDSPDEVRVDVHYRLWTDKAVRRRVGGNYFSYKQKPLEWYMSCTQWYPPPVEPREF